MEDGIGVKVHRAINVTPQEAMAWKLAQDQANEPGFGTAEVDWEMEATLP